MASGKQYSPASAPYSIVSATNMHASYPATRLKRLVDPSIYARTSSITAPVIVLDFGATVTVGAFSIENVNFQDLTIEGSADGSTWVQSQIFHPSLVDRYGFRRKLVMRPSATWSYRYARLTPGSLDASMTYFRIGSFGAWPTLSTLSHNVSVNYGKTLVGKTEQLDMGPREEMGLGAPIRVLIDATADPYHDDGDALDQYAELASVPGHRVILWADNEGDDSQMYHVQRASDFKFTRGNSILDNVSGLQFREVL